MQLVLQKNQSFSTKPTKKKDYQSFQSKFCTDPWINWAKIKKWYFDSTFSGWLFLGQWMRCQRSAQHRGRKGRWVGCSGPVGEPQARPQMTGGFPGLAGTWARPTLQPLDPPSLFCSTPVRREREIEEREEELRSLFLFLCQRLLWIFGSKHLSWVSVCDLGNLVVCFQWMLTSL